MFRAGSAALIVASMVLSAVVQAQVQAPGSPVGPDEGDWRAEWYARRNVLVESNPKLTVDPGSILVQFHPASTLAAREGALARMGGRTIRTWSLVPGLHHVAVSRPVGESLRALQLAALVDQSPVIYAEPDSLARLGATPNDTYYSLLWGLNNTGQTVNRDRGTANADIDADLAWDVITGGNVAVGMADSGIRASHEDLAANRWTNPGEIAGNGLDDDGNGYVDDTWGWDFWNNDNNPSDDNGHGSHTAGTVGAAGNNGKGVVGVCWSVRLAGLKIGSASGSVSISAAIGSLDYCVGKGIRLSNHSWGGGSFSAALNSAISAAQAAGHLLVCAAGNGGADGRGDNNDALPHYPSSYAQDNIISVAAIDNDNKLAKFSNYGATSVDVGAPGVTIASCYNSSDAAYVYMNGTSMATPHVTGVAALVWAQNPGWTYSQVRSKILSSVKPVAALAGKSATGGCVNANNAVR
ncbi:MAG: subtilase [Phycisphaerae bacterium]|nr:subtilase [Phycisphaerae bacterium]